jgi:hypothetical protein
MTARANRHRVTLSRAIPSSLGKNRARSNEEPAQEAVSLGRRKGGSVDLASAFSARRIA